MEIGDQRLVQQIDKEAQENIPSQAPAPGGKEKDSESGKKNYFLPGEKKDSHLRVPSRSYLSEKFTMKLAQQEVPIQDYFAPYAVFATLSDPKNSGTLFAGEACKFRNGAFKGRPHKNQDFDTEEKNFIDV